MREGYLLTYHKIKKKPKLNINRYIFRTAIPSRVQINTKSVLLRMD